MYIHFVWYIYMYTVTYTKKNVHCIYRFNFTNIKITILNIETFIDYVFRFNDYRSISPRVLGINHIVYTMIKQSLINHTYMCQIKAEKTYFLNFNSFICLKVYEQIFIWTIYVQWIWLQNVHVDCLARHNTDLH